jgi:hypothetical protein
MFPRNYRLPLRSIPDFFVEAQKFQSGFCTVFFRPAEHLQLVVVVPKRAVALSSGRNHMRRIFYAALLANLRDIATKQAQVCIVVQRNIPKEKITQVATYLIRDLQKRLPSVQ